MQLWCSPLKTGECSVFCLHCRHRPSDLLQLDLIRRNTVIAQVMTHLIIHTLFMTHIEFALNATPGITVATITMARSCLSSSWNHNFTDHILNFQISKIWWKLWRNAMCSWEVVSFVLLTRMVYRFSVLQHIQFFFVVFFALHSQIYSMSETTKYFNFLK